MQATSAQESFKASQHWHSMDPGGQELDETAWLAASGVLQGLLAAKLLWNLRGRKKEILSSMVQAVARYGRYMLGLHRRVFCKGSATRADTDELLVAREVSKLRLSIARRYSLLLTFLSCVLLAMVQWNIIFKKPRWMTDAFSWLMVGCFASLVFTQLFPCLLSVYTLDFWYLLGSASLACCLWPQFVHAEYLTAVSGVVLVVYRLPAAIMTHHYFFVLLANLISVLMTYLRTVLEDHEEAVAWAVHGEVICTLAVVLLSSIMRSALERFAEQFVRGTKATTELNAASALLELTCDAVLELQEDLTVATCSPQLAAMLLRGQGNCMAGLSFTDFVAGSDDKQRAAEILRNSTDCEANEQRKTVSARAFHTRLVDACGSKFRTEVFQVSYHKLDGSIHHLLGLRDFTDQKSIASNAVDAISEGEDSRPEETVQPASRSSRLGLLEVDIDFMQVCAASAPLGCLAGKALTDVFSAATSKRLKRLWDEVLLIEARGDLAQKVLPFGTIDLRLSSSEILSVSGTTEVIRTSTGELELFLCFSMPPSFPSFRSIRRSSRRSHQSGNGDYPTDAGHFDIESARSARRSSYACSL